MGKVSNILLFVFLGILFLTQDFIEAVLFLILVFLLAFIIIVTTRHVQRYLIKRRFEKDVFTEDFYARLNDVLKNEFK